MPRVHAMLRRERRYTRAHPHWRHNNGRGAGCCEEASAAECATLAPFPIKQRKARPRPPPSTSVQTRTIHRSGPKMDPRSISWQRPQGEGEEEAEEEALPFEVWDNGTSRKRLAIWLLAPGRPFLETCTWVWHAYEEAMRREKGHSMVSEVWEAMRHTSIAREHRNGRNQAWSYACFMKPRKDTIAYEYCTRTHLRAEATCWALHWVR